MSFQVLGLRVLIQRDAPKTMTAGGLHIPEKHADKPVIGKVLGQGEEVPRPLVGKRVLYSKYAGQEVTLDEQQVMILRYEDVIGVFDGDEESADSPEG